MTENITNSHFKFMTMALKIRDIFKPPKKVLKEANIKLGDTILDFGCGPGSYSLAAANLVGEKGQVYSLDKHPMAIKSVKRRALRRRLKNIEPVFSDKIAGLADKSMDVILVYDVFHEFDEPGKYLAEMNRLLKNDGIISINDHHLDDQEIQSGMIEGDYFQLAKKDKKTHTFKKAET
ncbi:class I SAM-dependent methyltransferase [Acidobacteriota bacterium]